MKEPSYEVLTSKRYHDLHEALWKKYGIKVNGQWQLPNKDSWKDIPKEEWEVMFWYPPIDVYYITTKPIEKPKIKGYFDLN